MSEAREKNCKPMKKSDQKLQTNVKKKKNYKLVKKSHKK